jgi:thiamine-monophosphate kinase
VKQRGENELVRWLAEHLRCDPQRVPIGIGDDMAAVRLDGSLVAITADMLLDGVHFDTTQHGYELIGRKAIACSLSDCAGMACRPRAATVSLALAGAMSMTDVQALYAGMNAMARHFDCPVVGGDTTSWTGALAIDVAMIAEPMSPRGPIQRGTAQAGDMIFVSGPLGGSIAGRHLTFTPRLELAERLAAESDLHAMMDISDGLSLDLHRLCLASRLRAELPADGLAGVISDDARRLADEDGRSPLDHALSDGEDFELLVCGGAGLMRPDLGLTPIGTLQSAEPAQIGTMQLLSPEGKSRLEPRGYEHFR